MENIIKNCIEDGNRTGLYRISFPTGSGKSYEAVRYMAENYMNLDEGRYFFFITSKKINLPKKMLLKRLGKDEYRKNVIVVKSYFEYILDNFRLEEIPLHFHEQPVYDLSTAVEIYRRKKEKNIYDADDIREAEKRVCDAESHFRTYIYTIIRNLKETLTEAVEKSNESEETDSAEVQNIIYSYLKEHQDYQWIGKIYENIFIKDYKIILMSTTKFLKKNQPFYESGYSFINGAITDEAIIFIDEFDSSKETISNELVSRSINNLCEYISLSETICRNMMNYTYFPKRVQNVFEFHRKELDRLLKLAEENYNIYRLNLKYKCEELLGRNFLFNDFSYQSILNSDKRIYVQYNEDKGCMLIRYAKKEEMDKLENRDDIINMYSLIQSLNRMIRLFKDFIYKAAQSYETFYNHSSDESDDVMNFENALSTLCSLFGFDEKADRFMRNGLVDRYSRKKVSGDIAIKTNNYYTRGFKFYELKNSLSANEFTVFNITELSETPESIIAVLASKAKVIGLSATINVDSVLCNYSQDFLKRTLGDNYREVKEEDFRRVEKKYNHLNRKYASASNPDGEIKVHVSCVDHEIGTDSKEIKKKIAAVFRDSRNIRIIDNLLSARCQAETFSKDRYLSVAYVFREFMMNRELKSFLCLTNPTLKANGNFDEDVIRKMFDIIIEENHISVSNSDEQDCYLVLKSGSEFEGRKEELEKRLHKGDKIFVMAAYGTLEAGQNLTYKPARNDRLVNLNDSIDKNDARNLKKDFDGIYLGEMTNLTTNLYDKDRLFTQTDLFNYLIEAENLYENNELTNKDLKLAVKNGFLRYSDRNSKFFDPIKPLLKSRCGKVTKQTVQSVGRLCRTFNKRQNIYIYLSRSVFDMFDPELIRHDLICPEVKAICEYINQHRSKLVYDEVNNKAERNSLASRDYIYNLFKGQWDEKKMRLWKELRDRVLMYPTVSEKNYLKDILLREYYISSENQLDRYYFYEKNDFTEVYVLFDSCRNEAIRRLKDRFKKQENTIEEVKLKECSYENSRLEEILKYRGMKEFFKENRYAISFRLNDYIMSPVLYQNIYKGALGEMAGRFILETELDIKLSELQTEFFEYFDYMLTKDIYVDFKHWRMNSVDKDSYLKHISTKLTEIGGKKAYIINILDENQYTDRIIKTYEGRIIEVPFLIDRNGYIANREIIEMLEEDLHYDR